VALADRSGWTGRRGDRGWRRDRLRLRGCSGHGNVLGLACGELLAGAILGAPAPELELFDPARLLGG
jgi:glycine/D-amino acid oxidase-like deaminating enzyme